MRTVDDIQKDLNRCYLAIAEMTAGNRISRFSFSSTESSRTYEKAYPTLTELEGYRDSLIAELRAAEQASGVAVAFRPNAFYQTNYNKF